ncbi:phosphoesterase PA-phosphatase [Actinomycetes bacterium KLBMP 9797]
MARAITEVFAPAVLAATMPVVVAVTSAPTLVTGLGWGALAALFSAVIPYGVIRYGVWRGTLTDHHMARREQRRRPLSWGLASVTISLILFAVVDAPRPLTAMVAVMLAVLAIVTVVNLWWKMSGHAAVSAGSATVLTILFGGPAAVAWVVVVLTCWSRTWLNRHSSLEHDGHNSAQVIAGATAGTISAAVVYLAVAH